MCEWGYGRLSAMQKNMPAENMRLSCWRVSEVPKYGRVKTLALKRKVMRSQPHPGDAMKELIANAMP
jgi:hypothetical protein